MSYIVLARKYRPQTFAEVYAQEHVTDILSNAIKSNRVNHAYLFNGPRGVGKTSLARIMAKSLNCEHGPTVTPCNVCSNCIEITSSTSTDVIEIDGASNNSVDDIRELQEELMYAPGQSKYKIYIIDEVHMLSKSAFNALLKTLEEPPENVIFIFATTEPHKVPPTIISRCQRYDFKRIPVESIVKRIKELATEENVTIDDESVYLIARKADGGLRDALSLMDQVLAYCLNNVSIEKVREIFGMLPNLVFLNLLTCIRHNESKALVEELHSVVEQGTELHEFLNNFMDFLRLSLLRQIGLAPSELSPDEYAAYDQVAKLFSRSELLYIISALMQCKTDIRSSANPQLILEVVMVKLSQMAEMSEISQIISKLDKMNNQVNGTSLQVAPTTQPTQLQRALQNQSGIPPQPEAETQQKASVPVIPFNETTYKEKMPKLIEKCKRAGTAASGITLSQAKVIEIDDKNLKLMIDGNSGFQMIKKYKETIETILMETFGTPIKLHLTLSEAPAPNSVSIKRKTLSELKQEHPHLSEYLELTDSIPTQS